MHHADCRMLTRKFRKDHRMKRIRNPLQAKERLWDVAFGALLVIELLLWGWLNLHEQFVNDHDSAKVLYHAMCMWEEKTLLIPGWKYMTTAELDCSALPATLFYGITGNILLSFALANILHVLCFSWILLRLYRNLGLQDRYACITITAVLLPFELGMLSYANMLFYGAAQYIYKTLLPIWMLELLTAPRGSFKKPGWILQMLVFSFLTFLTALSSGMYVFLCGLFPLIACTAVFILRAEQIKLHGRKIAICLSAVLLTLCGFVMQKALGLSTFADQMDVVLLKELTSKLSANFIDLFWLTRALPLESVSLYTLGGIMYVVRFSFVICVLLLGLQGLKGWSAESGLRAADEQEGTLRYAGAALSGIFIWNAFIQVLTISSTRYHLIGFIPLMAAAGITFALSTKKQSAFVQFFHFGCAAAALLVMMVGCWNSAFSSSGNYYKDYYDALKEIAQKQGADSVVFVNDSAAAEMARVFDPERVYVSYLAAKRSLSNYDAYDYYDDRSVLTDRHLLVATQMGGPSDLPDYLQHGYEIIGDVFGDPVYLAQTCYLDGTAGPIRNRTAVDYPYTQGYLFDTSMSGRGFFPKGEERIAFQSPLFDPHPSATRISLYYQLEDGSDGAWLDVNISGKVSERMVMPHGQQRIDFEIPAGESFSFAVGLCKETELFVDRITFDWL